MISATNPRHAHASLLVLAGFLIGCGTSGAKGPPDGGAPDGGPSDAGPPDAGACTSDGGAPAPVPYATQIPPREGLWVLDITGETSSREIIARTLQGAVNRSKARIYIVDDDANPASSADVKAANLHWLAVYQDQLGISPTGMGNLDAALAAFAPELEGYFLVDEQEPWSINAAITDAGTRKVVLATMDDVAALQGVGLTQLDSYVGRWADGTDCYLELAKRVTTANQPAFAVMNTDRRRLRDFLVQQGIVSLAGFTDAPEWAGVTAALARSPQGVPIYGYTATTAVEEANSVTDISQAGDVLVASDSTGNLSYHMAARPKAITRPPPVDTSVDCASAELNVVVGLSDGDNLVVSTLLYPTTSYWLSPDRGKIPIAWSISPSLATLAPTVLDYYTRTVAPNDELVMMIGAGYAYGGFMPNSGWFYGESFAEMEAIGLRVLWLFDPFEMGGGHYSWKTPAEEALACGHIDGLLDGYYPSPVHNGLPTEVVGGVPVIRAQGAYSDAPADIAAHIQSVLALPKAQRPSVAFYSAAVWSNPVPGLVAALTPLESQGVRFLSASAGVRCAKQLGDGGT
jgi:hypothetical protein